MKKILSFTLAVALAFSFLLGSAFASSGVTVVAPDTFISWGSPGDLTTLAVPSDAVSDGNKYIVYQVRDWLGFYFRVRFVIDSFERGDPVEGQVLSWTRYTGEWGLGVDAALEPSSYQTEYHAGEEYTYSKNFLHLPVKSNFDYYDADGELIISGNGYVNTFEGLVDLTLNDGTVIQVPRRLVGNQFVVVRSAADSGQYKIWNFGRPDTLDGIYEGAEGVSYSTSVGYLLSTGSPVIHGNTVLNLESVFDLVAYPYVVIFGLSSWAYCNVYCSAEPMNCRPGSSDGSYSLRTYDSANTSYQHAQYFYGTGEFGILAEGSGTSASIDASKSKFSLISNYALVDFGSETVVFQPTFSLSGGWQWSDWGSSTAVLDLTSYGDIVYQTFDYPLSDPEDEPFEPPVPDDDTDTSDTSNNGLFPWLKMQWVFLLQKLQNIVDAVKDLTVNVDVRPDKTRPLLDDFFTNIFDNGVSTDDVVGLGGVLSNVRSWFDNDFKLADLWDLFDEEYMSSWFTEETRLAIDSTGGVADDG